MASPELPAVVCFPCLLAFWVFDRSSGVSDGSFAGCDSELWMKLELESNCTALSKAPKLEVALSPGQGTFRNLSKTARRDHLRKFLQGPNILWRSEEVIFQQKVAILK